MSHIKRLFAISNSQILKFSNFQIDFSRPKSLILSLFALLSFFPVKAQITTGAWRDHLPYNQCIKVVEIGNKIYCATNNNLFTYNTSDNSIEKLSKINGLSDIGVSTMEYYQSKNILLIAYNDGNIDLLSNNVISNIPYLKNKSMIESKTANHILFNYNYAYISYSFGILVIDLVKKEIKDNYIIGATGAGYTVNSVAADDSNFYAATNSGIFSASINNPFLVDYSQWHLVTNIPNANGPFDKICYYNGMIIANSVGSNNNPDKLYYLKNNIWTGFLPGASMHKHEIRQWGNWLLITGNNEVYQLGQNLNVVNQYSYSNPYSTLIDNSGNAWFADNNEGLVLKSAVSQNYSNILPDGFGPTPQHVGDVWRMQYHNGSIYVTGGGADNAWTPVWTRGELFQFSNQTWTSIINETVDDFTTIAVDPVNPNKVYVGSWNSGVLVYNNGQLINNYTNTNSPLIDLSPGPYIYVGGTTFDAANNLWVTNTRSTTPLLVLKPDGTWKTIASSRFLSTTYLSDVITIDQGQNHQVWVVAPREDYGGLGINSGLFAFSYTGTVDNESNVSATSLLHPVDGYGNSISSVFCAVLDNNQEIWAGTSTGVIVYNNPGLVFSSNVSVSQYQFQPYVPLNDGKGTVYPLLTGIQVNCIAVDGANQKWVGTQTGGAFLVSADGTKQIYNFNVNNSPILSNNVKAIAIDGTSGEVFFGTDQGIISYRAVATTGSEDFSHVYVYPDPVRDSYHGDIIITGLMTNTIVKITDISGNLVFQAVSEGGRLNGTGTSLIVAKG